MASAEQVADLLLSRPATLCTTRLLAIDGPSGSGKSMLAEDVLAALEQQSVSAGLVSLDSLYEGWTGLDDHLKTRVLEQILLPLAAGKPARWQAYDWHSGRFSDWNDLGTPDAVVLEGCGAGARGYQDFISLLAWVEAPESERHARALIRDGEDVRGLLGAWWLLEAEHFRANGTKSRADLVIDTSAVALRSDI